MEITKLIEHSYHIISVNDDYGDPRTYRRISANHWQLRYLCNWEDIYFYEELESLYQNYTK